MELEKSDNSDGGSDDPTATFIITGLTDEAPEGKRCHRKELHFSSQKFSLLYLCVEN